MPLTRQEIFDKAYLGIAAQGFVMSQQNLGRCAYRGAHGLKCAIGQLIPDDRYDPKMEIGISVLGEAGNTQIDKIWNQFPIFQELIGEGDLRFAKWLQAAHDNGYTPENMKEELTQFADRNNLTIPEIPES